MDSHKRIGGILSHITPSPTASVDDIPVIDTHQHMWYSRLPTPPRDNRRAAAGGRAERRADGRAAAAAGTWTTGRAPGSTA